MSADFANPEELQRFLSFLKEPRRTILKVIARRPGVSTDELYAIIKGLYGISRNALYYHLDLLERLGLVRRDSSRPRRRYLTKKRLCLVIDEERLKD